MDQDSDGLEKMNPAVVPLVSVILVSAFISMAIVPDMMNYKPFDINRWTSATHVGSTYFILYQDYRDIHSSVVLVVFNSSTSTVSQNRLVSGPYDCIRPKAYVSGEDLVIGWLELQETTGRFCYARYFITTGELGAVTKHDFNATARATDFSFDGQNFTVATVRNRQVQALQVDTAFDRNETSSRSLEGDAAGVCVDGPLIYFGVTRSGRMTIMRMKLTDPNAEQVLEVQGGITEFTVGGSAIAWLVKGTGGRWGTLNIAAGNKTVSRDLERESMNIVVTPCDGGAAVTWSEWQVSSQDDDDSNYEVRTAFIPDLTSPVLGNARTLSDIDGSFSTNPAVVAADNVLRAFWLDGGDGYSLRTCSFSEGAMGAPVVLLENGEAGWGIGFILSMTLGMVPSMAMMGLLLKGRKRTILSVRSHSAAPSPITGLEPVAPNIQLMNEGARRGIFQYCHKPRSYLFIRFYMPIVGGLMALLSLSDVFLTDIGTGIGFRIGYSNILGCAVGMFACLVAAIMLWDESRVTPTHFAGFLLLVGGFVCGCIGLGYYILARAAFAVDLLYVVRPAAIISGSLAVLGASTILYGLSRNRGFLMPHITYVPAILFTFLDLSKYGSLTIFPSIRAVSKMSADSSGLFWMMANILFAMFFGMLLFDILRPELVKRIKEWTRAELEAESWRALAFSVLLMTPVTLFSMSYILATPFPSWDSLSSNPWITLSMIGMMAVMVVMVRFMSGLGKFQQNFEKKPSASLYSIFCWPVMYSMVIMILGIFLGAIALAVLVLYARDMAAAMKAVRRLPLEQIQAEAKDEPDGD